MLEPSKVGTFGHDDGRENVESSWLSVEFLLLSRRNCRVRVSLYRRPEGQHAATVSHLWVPAFASGPGGGFPPTQLVAALSRVRALKKTKTISATRCRTLVVRAQGNTRCSETRAPEITTITGTRAPEITTMTGTRAPRSQTTRCRTLIVRAQGNTCCSATRAPGNTTVETRAPYNFVLDNNRNSTDNHDDSTFSRPSSCPKVPTFDGSNTAQFRPWIIQFEAIARHQV